MTMKQMFVSDLNKQKAAAIEMLKTNLSEEDRQAVANKLNDLDERIANIEQLEDADEIKFNSALTTMEQKMDAIKEKLSENNIKVKGVSESYLESKNAVKDFADSLRGTINRKGSFDALWGEKLSTNGISYADGTPAGAYLPEPVKGMIDSKWQEYGRILGYFTNTGAKAFYVRYTSQSQDSTDVRAKGFTSNSSKTKTEQSLVLTAKLLQSEFVYKMISISNKTIWEDDNKLIEFVMDELLKQWHYEILRAIVVGDGRSSSSDDKITTIEAIARTTSDAFVTVYKTSQSTTPTLEYYMDNVVLPLYNGEDDIILFVSKTDANALRKRATGSGSDVIYRPLDEVAREMGVREIVVVPFLDASTASAFRGVAVHARKYAIVGSLNPQFASFEDFKKNEVLFRVEIPVGGGTAGVDAAIVAQNPAS